MKQKGRRKGREEKRRQSLFHPPNGSPNKFLQSPDALPSPTSPASLADVRTCVVYGCAGHSFLTQRNINK